MKPGRPVTRPQPGTHGAIVLAVLERFTLITPTELAVISGIERDLLYRTLATLAAAHFVDRDDGEDGARYSLGPLGHVEPIRYQQHPDRRAALIKVWKEDNEPRNPREGSETDTSAGPATDLFPGLHADKRVLADGAR